MKTRIKVIINGKDFVLAELVRPSWKSPRTTALRSRTSATTENSSITAAAASVWWKRREAPNFCGPVPRWRRMAR